jgi:hypothetical protein
MQGRSGPHRFFVVTGTDGETTASVLLRGADAGTLGSTSNAAVPRFFGRPSVTILNRTTGALVDDGDPPLILLPDPVVPGVHWRVGPPGESCSLQGEITRVCDANAFVEYQLVCDGVPSSMMVLKWHIGGGIASAALADGGLRYEFVKRHP